MLRSYGHQMTFAEFQQRHAGRPTKVNAATIVKRYALPVGADELVARKDHAVADFLAKSPFPLMPGAREATSSLKAAGLKLAIVTAGGADAARATAAKHFAPGTFAGIVTGEDVCARSHFRMRISWQ
ncbi:HAD family hydrolase [Streptococcus pyogenes]|uniref:HAD family hydrolase n=1 Tax=Streptococcus pyogenes TaxID=1314 RepID=UPI003D9FED59